MYSASGDRLKSCVPQDATLVCVEWFEDAGKRFQYQLIDSRKEGPYRAWHQSGQLAAEGQYQRGRREGVWRFLNEDGSVDAERSGTYKNGALEDGVHP